MLSFSIITNSDQIVQHYYHSLTYLTPYSLSLSALAKSQAQWRKPISILHPMAYKQLKVMRKLSSGADSSQFKFVNHKSQVYTQPAALILLKFPSKFALPLSKTSILHIVSPLLKPTLPPSPISTSFNFLTSYFYWENRKMSAITSSHH